MESDVPPYIPFMGGPGVNNETRPDQLAGWVQEFDRIPILLALSLYQSQPRKELDGFVLVPDSYQIRVAAWFNAQTGICIIGCRGTTAFGPMGALDVQDDKIIATATNLCNLTIVGMASKLVETLAPQVQGFIFAGHSLGGTSAFCLTQKYPNSRGIGFNSGAPPTNPVLTGPGPGRFTHYHIFGDLISSHMGPQAAKVVIVRKRDANFGGLYPHSSERILASDGWWVYATPDEEDKAYVDWGLKYKPGLEIVVPIGVVAKFLAFLVKSKVTTNSPIPGSKRFYGIDTSQKRKRE